MPAPSPNNDRISTAMTKGNEYLAAVAAATAAAAASPESRNSRAGELFLRTIGFLLDNRRKAEQQSGREWQSTTRRLQLVSLDACRAWRDTAWMHLKVTPGRPPGLWKQENMDTRAAVGTSDLVSGPVGDDVSDMVQTSVFIRQRLEVKSRVPIMRVTRVTWERSSKDLHDNNAAAMFFTVDTLRFGPSFDDSLVDVRWPKDNNIKKKNKRFNQALRGTNWPPALREVQLGKMFDQDVNSADFPKTLRKLVFGESFNMLLISWPEGLQFCVLGPTFNQDLTSAVLPPHLKKLACDWRFNSSLDSVVMREGLEELEFRGTFDKPLPAKLPAGLKNIPLRLQFNQPIGSVQWPDNCEHIVFGFHFDQPIDRDVLPGSLQSIAFGNAFQQSLGRVHWPESVQDLLLGRQFG